MAGGLPEVAASLPDATAPNLTQNAAIPEPVSLKGMRLKNDALSLKGGGIPGKGRTDRKPHAPAGYEWHAQSKGFTCRRIVKEDGKRRRVYVGFLSGKAWADMQKNHSGPELRAAVKRWIEGKEKG